MVASGLTSFTACSTKLQRGRWHPKEATDVLDAAKDGYAQMGGARLFGRRDAADDERAVVHRFPSMERALPHTRIALD
jgi:hypothetical protein